MSFPFLPLVPAHPRSCSNLLWLLSLLLSPPLQAQTKPDKNEAPVAVGRLFLQPGERRQLEINPDIPTSLDIVPEENFNEKNTKQIKGQVVANGIIMRRSGKHTVWINGQATEYQGPYDSKRPPLIVLPLSGEEGGDKVAVKPGQSANPRLGTQGDSFTPPPLPKP